MGLFDHFPYTNVHELNLDWILSMMKALEAEWEAFTAGNSLQFADPMLHDISKTYAKNTIVLDGNGNAYVSLQAIPVGVGLQNGDYWLMVFDYEAFIEKVNKNFTANYYRGSYRATAAMAIGDWLTVDDVLYKATAAIAVDDILEDGVNITHFTMEDFIKAFMQSANQLIQQYKNDIDASELLYRQQLAQDIANTTASLQAQLNLAISGATVDSEVINARLGADGVTYPTLGDAMRTQIGRLIDASLQYDDIHSSINALDHAAEIMRGKYVSYSSGNIGDAPDYTAFYMIPVKPNAIYWNILNNFNNAHVAFYDYYGSYVSGILKNYSDDDFSIITVPNNCHYMTVSLDHRNSDDGFKNMVVPMEYLIGESTIYDIKYGTKNILDLSKIYNRNLIDRDLGLKNAYYYYSNGNFYQGAHYNAMELPAIANTEYVVSPVSSHVSFFDSDWNFISGTNNVSPFTTPANCAYMRIGFRREYDDNTPIYPYLCIKGNVDNRYNIFGNGDGYYAGLPKIITVGTNKEYSTITDAVAAAGDNDIILIYPGTYNESINANSKKLHFIGVSKEDCIIQYSADDYYYPPLLMAQGSCENLTIYANWNGDTSHLRAFCVHIESDYERNNNLTFRNTDFISERGATVGTGLRTGCHLKFENCTFHTTATGVEGPIYTHTSEQDAQGYSNQNVEYKDCIIINETNQYSIHLQSQERQDKCCDITFINNKVIQPNNNGHTIYMTLWDDRTLTNTNYLGSSDFVLTNISEFNSDALMNYSTQ